MALVQGSINFSMGAKDGDLVRQPDGTYLLIWISGVSIQGQVFDKDGTKLGSEFSAYNGGATLSDISIAALKDGTNRTIMTWMESGSIKTLILSADHTPSGPVQTVDWNGLSSETAPKVHALDDGGYAIMYQAVRQGQSGPDEPWYGLHTAHGGQGGSQNLLVSPIEADHAVAVLTSAESVVIYANFNGNLQVEIDQKTSFIERFAGSPAEAHPSVTALAGGGFIVTWQDDRTATDSMDVVRAQLFDATHTATGHVTTFTKPPGTILHTTVSQLADGSFALALTMDEVGDENIYVMTCSADGATVTEPVFVGQSKIGDQTDPSIIPLGGDTFVVGWMSQVDGQDAQFMTEIFNGTETPANTAPTNVRLTTGNGSAVDIAENAEVGAFVAKVTAADNGPSGELRYAMADNAAFVIDALTGDIKVKAGTKLDYEMTKTYSVEVTVKDLNGTGMSSAAKTITINVSDIVDVVNGTSGKNVLKGASGVDRLNGLYGNDTLTGGAGTDFFIFDSKLGSSKTDRTVNFDKITDFSAEDDTIWLDNKVFKKLGAGSEARPGKLSKSFFVVGDKAKDKNDYLVYNKKAGVLSYDADGSGKGQAVEFAQLSKNPTLKNTDFFII